MQTTTTTRGSEPGPLACDDRYSDLLSLMQRRIDDLAPARLYETEVEGSLYDFFLAALPAHRRAHYQCRACRSFVERHGGLVALRGDGTADPAVWPDPALLVGSCLEPAVAAVRRAVLRAPIRAVFYVDRGTVAVGLPAGPGIDPSISGPWRHMSVMLPKPTAQGTTPGLATDTAGQARARSIEERKMLQRALADYPRDLVVRAHALLTAGALPQAEKHAPAAAWLLALIDERDAIRHERVRDAIVWRAVATAPSGWAHLRGGTLGALLDDLKSGLPEAAVRDRHAERVDPLKYQRAQAAPKAGNINRAERLIVDLGLTTALDRRFARLAEDVLPRALWVPRSMRPERDTGRTLGGVFAHLRDQPVAATKGKAVDGGRVTFARLARDVLPRAVDVHLEVPSGHAPFCALVAAANPLSKPILQWDREHDRLTLSWYLHHPLDDATRWGLMPRTLARVTAIALGPHLMREPGPPPSTSCTQHGPQVHLVLEGCRDARPNQVGGGLFPSHLRAELHEVRATIEHHAKQAVVAGREQADACGIVLQGATFSHPVAILVTADTGATTRYSLDRWD